MKQTDKQTDQRTFAFFLRSVPVKMLNEGFNLSKRLDYFEKVNSIGQFARSLHYKLL